MSDHSQHERRALRSVVRGAYDIQKLRMQTGGRIVANFKARIGQKPSGPEKELGAEGKEILKMVRAAYERTTDGMIKFPTPKQFVGDQVISTYTELCLVAEYESLLSTEQEHFKRIDKVLGLFPIYTDWLSNVPGIGPAMGGVLVSEIDIRDYHVNADGKRCDPDTPGAIARPLYPSSLWAYAGLDVVGGWKLADAKLIQGDENAAKTFLPDIPTELPLRRSDLNGNVTFVESENGRGPRLFVNHLRPDFQIVAEYGWWDSGGRSRRKEHLVMVKYTDKKGEQKERLSITFNPWLKTKIMGVLVPGFLKVGPDKSKYAGIYYERKQRLENHVRYGTHNDGLKDENGTWTTSKNRRHYGAMRFAAKRFLVDLYVAWRTLEGLTVSKPYEEAKLGLVHGAPK